jgi:hypothetical protein
MTSPFFFFLRICGLKLVRRDFEGVGGGRFQAGFPSLTRAEAPFFNLRMAPALG